MKKGIVKFSFSCLLIVLCVLVLSCPNRVNSVNITLSEFEISGYKGETITPIELEFTIENDGMFASLDAHSSRRDVSAFFTPNIDGLEYTVTESISPIGAKTLKVEISGILNSDILSNDDENIRIVIDKSYIKNCDADVEVKGTYKQIIKEMPGGQPTLSITPITITSFVNENVKNANIVLNLENATFKEENISKDEDGLRSWIIPYKGEGGALNGLKYTFSSLNDKKTELTISISGMVDSEYKNVPFSVRVPSSSVVVPIQVSITAENSEAVYNITNAPSASINTSTTTIVGQKDIYLNYTLSVEMSDAIIDRASFPIEDVSKWFLSDDSVLPDGLKASASLDSRNDSLVNIGIKGTPIGFSEKNVSITIPSSLYSYKNTDINETEYPKKDISVNTNGLKYDIKDPNRVYVMDENIRISAFCDEVYTNPYTIVLKSDKDKFSSALIDTDVTSWFSTLDNPGFKYTAKSLSSDGSMLTVEVKDNRTASQLSKVNRNSINITIPPSGFENAKEAVSAYSQGLSYNIVNKASARAENPQNFIAAVSGDEKEVIYTIRANDIHFINLREESGNDDGDDIKSWFFKENGTNFALDGLTYTVKSIENGKTSATIVLKVKGSPLREITGDEQVIGIFIPKGNYEYIDDNLNALDKSDIKVDTFTLQYEIYNVSATISRSVDVYGFVGQKLQDKSTGLNYYEVVVNMSGAQFKNIAKGTPCLSWFGNDISYLNDSNVYIKDNVNSGAQKLTIRIEGTPTKNGDELYISKTMSLTIPKEYIKNDLSSINVNTTVDGIESKWRLYYSAVARVEGLEKPIAALVNGNTIYNNKFKIKLDGDTFNNLIQPSSSNDITSWFTGAPSYLKFYATPTYDLTGKVSNILDVRVEFSSTLGINFPYTGDFVINVPSDYLFDGTRGVVFDETSVPQIARNYMITNAPSISEFKVQGALYGIINEDIEIYQNSSSYSQFMIKIVLNDACFTNYENVESWLSNYVHCEGLNFGVLPGTLIEINGKSYPTALYLYVEGTPTEAKRLFSTSDGVKKLSIATTDGNVVNTTNPYVGGFTGTFEKSVQTTYTDEGIYQESFSYDVNKTLSMGYQETKINSFYVDYNFPDDTYIRIDKSKLVEGVNLCYTNLNRDGWFYKMSSGNKLYLSQLYELSYSGYIRGSEELGFESIGINCKDVRIDKDQSYEEDKDVQITIPMSYLKPSFKDCAVYKRKAGSSLNIVSTT